MPVEVETENASSQLSQTSPDTCASCGAVAACHCSRCMWVKYCSKECQRAHWKAHRPSCAPRSTPSASTSTSHAAAVCLQCSNKWPECTCGDGAPSCFVCLAAEGVLLRGCACRGTSGYVHADCVVELNQHRSPEDHNKCPTCKTVFVGHLQIGVAEGAVRSSRSTTFDVNAITNLAAALSRQGQFSEALRHYRQIVKEGIKQYGPHHPVVAVARCQEATALVNLKKTVEALTLLLAALPTLQRCFGLDHPLVAKTYNK